MSHYLAYVLMPTTFTNDEDIEEFLADVMAPYREDYNGNGFWDYYTIGGRWEGHLEGNKIFGTVEEAPDAPFTLIAPEYVGHLETWDGKNFVDTSEQMLAVWNKLPKYLMILVVDYHC